VKQPADKAAFVLDTVAFRFRQLRVLFDRLGGADGLIKPGAQLFECNRLVRSCLCEAAVAIGNVQVSHGDTSSHFSLK